MIAILLLACGATLCVSLLLFWILRLGQNNNTRTHKNSRRASRSAAATQPGSPAGKAQTAQLVGPGSSSRVEGKKLSPAERQEMLEGVKNLAESNPEKVAGLIRNWMSQDNENPPRS